MLMSKEAPDIVETGECDYPHSTELIILSGLNELSSAALDGGEMNISTFPFKVGRKHADNDLYIQDFPPYSISRNHFLIDKVDGRYVVIDLGSRFGTIVNGRRINAISVLNRKENEIIAGPHHSPFVFKLEIR